MKLFQLYIIILSLLLIMDQSSLAQNPDWANLNRYKEDNSKIGLPNTNEIRVIFMGNSITEGWIKLCPDFFITNGYINRGISGQTTPQMLVRFRPDVVNLKPKVVVILAGTNDIAGNTGPSTLEMIEDNISSMVEIAQSNKIKVVLCSVLPAFDFPWKTGIDPAQKIVELNKWIEEYAINNNHYYVDYFTTMADSHNGLKKEFSDDGVHPNLAGYLVMEPLIENALNSVLNK